MNNRISTRNLTALPNGNELKKICQSIAMLDAILEPDWEYRYYSFNSMWNTNEEMASMRDGSGNSYFILFKPQGVFIKGLAHESSLSSYITENESLWKSVLSRIPGEFSDFLMEPAFCIEEISFCIWQKSSNPIWRTGNTQFPEGDDPDGSAELLFILDGNPKTYLSWAEYYYGRTLKIEPIEAVYHHEPLSREMLTLLNPNLDLNRLKNDRIEIGYANNL